MLNKNGAFAWTFKNIFICLKFYFLNNVNNNNTGFYILSNFVMMLECPLLNIFFLYYFYISSNSESK